MYIWNRFLHQLAGQLKRAENIIRQRIKRQETNQMKKNEKCYTNRELSWLQFNERVLNEAGNPRVPLAERMTFASIYQTNLDEFFMVRVGTLMMQMNAKEKVIENKTGMTSEEQVKEILARVCLLEKKKAKIYEQLMGELEPKGIRIINFNRLSNEEGRLLEQYFDAHIAPFLSPMVIGKQQPFPFLANKQLYAIVLLTSQKGKKKTGIVPCSNSVFKRLIEIPTRPGFFMLSEELILHFISKLYPKYTIREKSIMRVFGRDYILPKALDPRLLTRVSCAVAKAAIDSGVSRRTITDWEGYANHLREMMGYDNKLLRSFTDMAKANPKRVVFAEANHGNMLKAAAEAKAEGICIPILLGNEERLQKIAAEENISLEGIEIVNLRHDRETERRHRYAKILSEKKAREGVTYAEACEKMVDRNAFGMMMVATGDADAFVTGVYSRYSEVTKMAEQIIGIRPSYTHFGALNILTCKKGTFFIADTLINRHPSTEVLIDIARLTQDAVKFFAHEPVMAMLSYSNFGSDKQGSPLKVHDAIDYLHKNYPDMMVDGEMQVNFALDKKLRDDMYPFNKLKGKDVNTLIFPNLSSANSAYKLLDTLGISETIGPIQMGLNKPIHFTDVESSTRDILNLTTVAVVDAIVQEQIEKGE